jgi:predicted neutral ceramidase superfamily lipid hydrolase
VISVICGTVTVAVARLRAAVALKLKWGSLVSLLIIYLVGGELEKFKVDWVPRKAEATSGVKTPKQKLELPVAPESGHNST